MIKALIAAKANSKRVVNKNMRMFADSSLLEIKIKQLLNVKGLDGVVVNSESDVILETASLFGAEVIKRDKKYSTDTISMSDVYENMARTMTSDIIMYANCTNPLVKSQTYERAIKKYNEIRNEYDSFNSVELVKKFLWCDGEALNYDTRNQPRSQELPDITALNFAISIIPTARMIECRNVIGQNPYLYIMDAYEGLDIDTMDDFKLAEKLYA